MEEMKRLCVDCVYFVKGNNSSFAKCGHPMYLSRIDGSSNTCCYIARLSDRGCGIGGRLFSKEIEKFKEVEESILKKVLRFLRILKK